MSSTLTGLFHIKDKAVFGGFYLLCIPLMFGLVGLDKDTHLAFLLSKPRALLNFIVWLLLYSAIPAYDCHLLFNWMTLYYPQKFQNFLLAFIVGSALSAILIFMGLLLLFPLLFPIILFLFFKERLIQAMISASKN